MPQFAFHTCTTQREVVCTDALTTATNPPSYSDEKWSNRMQPAETGSDVLTLPRRSRDFLDIFVVVSYVCVAVFFSPGHICFVLGYFSFSPPHARGESSGGAPTVFSHWLPLDPYGLQRARRRNPAEAAERLWIFRPLNMTKCYFISIHELVFKKSTKMPKQRVVRKWEKKMLDLPPDPDPHQNWVGCFFGLPPPLQQMSWKMMQSFCMILVTNTQTQTKT